MWKYSGQHAQRGATKEKSRKLDELKAKRKAKDEKKRVRALNFAPLFDCSAVTIIDEDRLSEAGTFIFTDGHGNVR